MLDDKHAERLAFAHTMNRAILTVFLVGAALLIAIPACKDDGIGDPCTPDQEYDPSFLGFDEKEVNVESKSFQCRTRVCLVNHFRGRASCPYGQDKNGVPPTAGTQPCTIPGTTQAVTGLTNPADPTSFRDPTLKAQVSPQCVDRDSDKTVFCSCRCADINGAKPSNETFCDCPDGFACTQLVTSIGQGNEGLTGSYCIKNNTAYNADTACNSGDVTPPN
jgi:hypothetical protein